MNPQQQDGVSTSTDSSCLIQIQTKEGPINGYMEKKDNKTYYKFKSIPFAKPPLGQLRFLPPQTVAPWTEVLDCTRDTPIPVSVGPGVDLIGTEDCLYLEVFSPNVKPDKLMPVMFLMPGFGFSVHVEQFYDPSLINDQDVVYVNCNARLGPFGFLSINDMSAPGNLGLKDLVMGLKWVQRNISVFGGDPNNVTIFGTSSGGSMVHFMMLSPMATGLFHKAVMQSATALNNWSIDKNPTGTVTDLATRMGIQGNCMVTIVEKLLTCSKDEIMSVFIAMAFEKLALFDGMYVDSIFKPCIEQEYEGQQAFLTKSPLIIIKSGNFNKVPCIIGSNRIEGDFFEYINSNYKKSIYDYKKINENVSLMIPKPLAVEENLGEIVGRKIMKFYLGEDFLSEDNKNQYLRVIGDFFYIYQVNKTVRMHATVAPECPIYYYVVTQAGEWKLPKNLMFFNCCGFNAEIPFLFLIRTPGSEPYKGSHDSIMSRNKVVKMWTNFAKYGNPTPDEDDPLLQIKWDPVESPNKLNYLSIGLELTKGRNPFRERMAFWDDLLEQHQFMKILSFFQDMGPAC